MCLISVCFSIRGTKLAKVSDFSSSAASFSEEYANFVQKTTRNAVKINLKSLLTALMLSPLTVSAATEPVDYVNSYIGSISHLLVPCFPTVQLPNSLMRIYPTRNDKEASPNPPWFSHDDIKNGATLVLEMGSRPNKQWGSAAEAVPPSAPTK